jgi:CheY-specific phosphatase CheX
MDRKLQLDLIQAYAAATAAAFEQTCATPASAGKPQRTLPGGAAYGVSVLLNFDGELRGLATLILPEATALKAVSALSGEERSTLDAALIDGVRELAGVLSGLVRTRLDQQGYQFRLAEPRVAIGRCHPAATPAGGRAISVPYTSALGAFRLDLLLSGGDEEAAAESAAPAAAAQPPAKPA